MTNVGRVISAPLQYLFVSLLAVTQGCSQLAITSAESADDAEKRVVELIRRASEDGVPIHNSEELVRKLGITNNRADAIIVGDRAPALFGQRLDATG